MSIGLVDVLPGDRNQDLNFKRHSFVFFSFGKVLYGNNLRTALRIYLKQFAGSDYTYS